jgi:hypothetical protein
MRRPALILALSAAVLAAGCGKSNCQKLLERLCSCTGASSDSCTTTIEDQLKAANPPQSTEDVCGERLGSCNAPPGAQFCEWILTTEAKVQCGLAIEPQNVATTARP